VSLLNPLRRTANRISKTVRSFMFLHRRYFWQSDTEGTRFVIACSSLLWYIMLASPGNTFDRPTYSIMRMYASETGWEVAFLLYGLFALYILFARVYRKWLDIIISTYGCLLWMISCLSMTFAIWPLPAAISGEIVLSLASLWVLVRVIVDRGRRFKWSEVE
jgi:hypothetical protein